VCDSVNSTKRSLSRMPSNRMTGSPPAMGLFAVSVASPFLCIGVTMLVFHWSGISPDGEPALSIVVRAGSSTFSTLPSGGFSVA